MAEKDVHKVNISADWLIQSKNNHLLNLAPVATHVKLLFSHIHM